MKRRIIFVSGVLLFMMLSIMTISTEASPAFSEDGTCIECHNWKDQAEFDQVLAGGGVVNTQPVKEQTMQGNSSDTMSDNQPQTTEKELVESPTLVEDQVSKDTSAPSKNGSVLLWVSIVVIALSMIGFFYIKSKHK